MTLDQVIHTIGLGILMMAIGAAISRYGLARRSWPHTPLDWPLLAVLIALLISTTFSIDQTLSGLQVLTWCGYVSVFYLVLAVPEQWVTIAAQTIGWPIAAFCLGESLMSGARAQALQGNANIMAAWLLSLFFLVPSSWTWRIVGGAAIIATGSRGALLSALGALAVGYKIKWWLVLVIMLVGGGLLIAWRPSTVDKRVLTWTSAVRLFTQRPLIGWGPGTYARLDHGDFTGKPHADSLPLTVAAETGLVGLAAWAYLFYSTARLVIRSQARARLGLVAFAIHQIVDCTVWCWWPGIGVMTCLALTARKVRHNHC